MNTFKAQLHLCSHDYFVRKVFKDVSNIPDWPRHHLLSLLQAHQWRSGIPSSSTTFAVHDWHIRKSAHTLRSCEPFEAPCLVSADFINYLYASQAPLPCPTSNETCVTSYLFITNLKVPYTTCQRSSCFICLHHPSQARSYAYSRVNLS